MSRITFMLSLFTMMSFPLCAVAQSAAPNASKVNGEDPAWAMYQSAFVHCAAGRTTACKQTLKSIQKRYPQHPASTLAAGSLDDLANLTVQEAVKNMGKRGPNGEKYTAGARAELVSYQTVHGAFVGGELCAFADCSTRLTISSVMLGAGLGFGLSYALSDNGLTSGRASALNSGVSWGAWNGLMLNSTLDVNSDKFWLMMLGSQGAGMGLGYLYSVTLLPTGGQVALSNSGGLWTLIGSGILYAMLSERIESDALSNVALVSSNLGLIAGGILGQVYPVSRSRVSIIDSATLLGGLFGLGTAALFEADDANTYLGMTLVSGIAGMVASTYMTRNWDDDNEDVLRKRQELTVNSIGIAPIIQQNQTGTITRGLGLTIGGQW